MRAVEEESKKEEVLPTKLSSNKVPEVCPHPHSLTEFVHRMLSYFGQAQNYF